MPSILVYRDPLAFMRENGRDLDHSLRLAQAIVSGLETYGEVDMIREYERFPSLSITQSMLDIKAIAAHHNVICRTVNAGQVKLNQDLQSRLYSIHDRLKKAATGIQLEPLRPIIKRAMLAHPELRFEKRNPLKEKHAAMRAVGRSCSFIEEEDRRNRRSPTRERTEPPTLEKPVKVVEPVLIRNPRSSFSLLDFLNPYEVSKRPSSMDQFRRMNVEDFANGGFSVLDDFNKPFTQVKRKRKPRTSRLFKEITPVLIPDFSMFVKLIRENLSDKILGRVGIKGASYEHIR
jgi:hypothetical protein